MSGSVIAIVEPDAIVSMDMARTLGRAGYAIVGPYTELGAFISSCDSSTCDLLLLDPGFRSRVSSIEGIPPYLLVSSSAGEPLSEMNAIFGDSGFHEPLGLLSKPFSERDLLGAVSIALLRAGLERKLQANQRRYRILFDASIAPRCIADEEGRINAANAAFNSFFDRVGEDRKPAILTLQSIFGELPWAGIFDILREKNLMEPREYRISLPARGEKVVIAAFSRFPDPETGQITISLELFDMTEARRLEDELHHAQKMEALGRLAGSVAHDFNNILTTIIGHSQMMKLDTPPEDPRASDLDGVLKSADRASRLTKQLLGFGRKRPAQRRRIDLGETIRASETLLRRLSGERILLTLSLPSEPVQVEADPLQIEQVLVNLVANARDALTEKSGARISIGLRAASLAQAPHTASIWVEDNGVGIDPELQAKIFEPFFSTKEEGRGTGLGLAIVSSIVQQTGGTIGVESKQGEGTIFTISLPIAPIDSVEGLASQRGAKSRNAKNSGKPYEEAASKPHFGTRIRILLADDDEDVLGTLAHTLTLAGADVVAVRNAGEAILAMEAPARFDCLVTDIAMPGMDGKTLAKRLGFADDGRVLYCTGLPDWHERNLPQERVLEKPFAPADLIAAVKNLFSNP